MAKQSMAKPVVRTPDQCCTDLSVGYRGGLYTRFIL